METVHEEFVITRRLNPAWGWNSDAFEIVNTEAEGRDAYRRIVAEHPEFEFRLERRTITVLAGPVE